MNEFPFIAEDWQRVTDAGRDVVNATLADDDVLHASQLQELLAVLADLRTRYGEHPILLETEADFLDDPRLRAEKYRAALTIARRQRLPTASIEISFARLLLDEFRDSDNAARELRSCESELSNSTDEWEKQEWRELMQRCKSQSP